MNNIKEYTDFLNEGFWSKSFEDRIDEIDDLFIEAAEYNGKSAFTKHMGFVENRNREENLMNYLKTLSKITDLLNNLLKKYGRNLSQEQLNDITRRYTLSVPLGSGYKLQEYKYLINIKNNANSILSILKHLKNFYEMKVDIDEKRLNDNPLVFYKHENYFYIVHKSYADRGEKKLKDAHAGVDPLGEENWDDGN